MLTKEFIPSVCKRDPKEYEGYVKIRVPDFDERQQFFLVPEFDDVIDAAARAKVEGASAEDAAEEVAKRMNSKKMLAIMNNIRKQLPDYVLEISIKRLDDGFVFTSLDEVRYDSDVGIVTQEICTELIGKYRWGNQNTQQS